MRKCLFCLLLLTLTITTVLARPPRPLFDLKVDRFNAAAANYCFQRLTDSLYNLRLAYSNRMALGRPFSSGFLTPDDQEQNTELSEMYNAEFPAGSGHEYLYSAGLWVGGIKGDDTLVSHAFDLVYPIPDFTPAICPAGALESGAGLADREHIAVAYDTVVALDSIVRCQLSDCNDWVPLGLQVTSHSYAWRTPPYNNIVIVEYRIKNILDDPITEAWAGIYADADVGIGETAHTGDISGFIGESIDSTGLPIDLNMAYSMDFDGDPNTWDFGVNSVRGAFGVQLLGLSSPGYRVNFNWWVAPDGAARDWGPSQLSRPHRDNGAYYASPQGDSNKYALMSYPEIDYNQIEAGLAYPGWDFPLMSDRDAAMGGDTRFLISAGPFDLAPGEEVSLTVAYVAADNIIQNPFAGLWFIPEFPSSVADYYELTPLDSLEHIGQVAYEIYQNGLDFPPPGPPDGFFAESYDDTSCVLIWNESPVSDLKDYVVYQKNLAGGWEIAAEITAPDTSVTIIGLTPDEIYTFSVASRDNGDRIGLLSNEVSFQAGRINAIIWADGSGRIDPPQINWHPSMAPEVVGYRIYRTDESTAETASFDETDTVFNDISAADGHIYKYFVTAYDALNNESDYSDSLRLINYPSDNRILVIDQTDQRVTSNLVYSSGYLDTLVATALAEGTYDIHRVSDEGLPTINKLAEYTSIIVSSENRRGILPVETADLLAEYLDLEGRAVIILRHTSTLEEPTDEAITVYHKPGTFLSRYAKIDSTVIGPLIINAGYQLDGDMIGATAVSPTNPSLEWDSVRVNAFGYGVPDGLPYCGYIIPRAEATPLYTYLSGDGGPFDGRVNAISYTNDRYRLYLLNFPLSLMKLPDAATLLSSLVEYIPTAIIRGDVNGDGKVNIIDAASIAGHLFFAEKNTTAQADLNCNDVISLEDFLLLTNYIFYNGALPQCCECPGGNSK